jgi:hypothetical protein
MPLWLVLVGSGVAAMEIKSTHSLQLAAFDCHSCRVCSPPRLCHDGESQKGWSAAGRRVAGNNNSDVSLKPCTSAAPVSPSGTSMQYDSTARTCLGRPAASAGLNSHRSAYVWKLYRGGRHPARPSVPAVIN